MENIKNRIYYLDVLRVIACLTVVMVHIRRIREKLKDDTKNPKFIKTVWGVGYKIE